MLTRVFAVLFLFSASAVAEAPHPWNMQRIIVGKTAFYCGRMNTGKNNKVSVFTYKNKKFISFDRQIKLLERKKNSSIHKRLKSLRSKKRTFLKICHSFWKALDLAKANETDLTVIPTVPAEAPTVTSLATATATALSTLISSPTATPTVTETPTPLETSTATATSTATVSPTITATVTATLTRTATTTATPTSTPTENFLPSCPVSGSLVLSDSRPYIVTESTTRDCPVTINEGVQINIYEASQLIFTQKVSIAPPTSGAPQKVFYAPWAELNIKSKWWITPIVFLKRQVIYPEWFGAKLCAREDQFCTNASIPFQMAVNSLNAGKPKTIEEIVSQNLAIDDHIGGSIIAYQFPSPPARFYRLDADVINTRHHITIDLRNNYIHRDGELGNRFICNGDRNRSFDNQDASGRIDGYLEDHFTTESERWSHALFGCTLKRIRFGIPKTEASHPEDSSNMTGIANLLWVTGGIIEDVTRYGRGTTGISFNITRNSSINRASIYGSRDSYFSYNPSTRTYRWENRQIGILIHLSKNTKVTNSRIVRGAYFAGIQVKGGEDNVIESSEALEMRDPIEKLRIATPVGTIPPGVTQAVEFEPIPFANNTPLAYDNLPAKLVYGSRNAFWDRGDSPYVTPAANPSLLPKYSYPYEGKSFADQDERRASSRTVWSDLSVKNSPQYNAFSNTESVFSTYRRVTASNVSSGFVFTRSHNGKESGHEIVDFLVENVKIQGFIAQHEATPVPTASPNPVTPTPTVDYSTLVRVLPGAPSLISNVRVTPLPAVPTPFCYKPGANSPSAGLLSGGENITCTGF